MHDETIEVHETDEEAVVDKQARVVEEVVVRKDAQERTETVQDTVRRTHVDVDEVAGQTTTSGTARTVGATDGRAPWTSTRRARPRTKAPSSAAHRSSATRWSARRAPISTVMAMSGDAIRATTCSTTGTSLVGKEELPCLTNSANCLDRTPTRQQDYGEFVDRFGRDPSSIDDREAARRYREMMAQSRDDDEDDFGDDEVFGQLSSADRRALAQQYRDATSDPQRPYQGFPQDLDLERAADPRALGRMTRRAAREDPDLLEQLVGQNSPLSGTAGKLALAGGAAFLASRFLGRSQARGS